MGDRSWYRDFFDENFWAIARLEYDSVRTERETRHIAQTLAALAPGRRVLDVGCGEGRHALALAACGFDVVGIDVAPASVDRCRQRAEELSLSVEWHVVDALVEPSWAPAGDFDAVVLIQAWGWGRDFEQRRILRWLWHTMRPNGLLILDHSALAAIARNFVGSAEVSSCGKKFQLCREFDPELGEMTGYLTDAAATSHEKHHRVRLYSTHELLAMVQACGFDVVRVDADFQIQQPTLESRYVQIVARRVAVVPERLAMASYSTSRQSGGHDDLDLRWSLDEANWVDPSPKVLWRQLLYEFEDLGFGVARQYSFNDPYGGARAAPVLSQHLQLDLDAAQVFAGAGSTALLAQTAGIADGGPIVAPEGSHPDFARWARSFGSVVHTAAEPLDIDDYVAAIDDLRPAVVQVDSPTSRGELLTVGQVADLAAAACHSGAVLVVDEAYGVYFSGGHSVSGLVSEFPNVVVVRSVSKGYSMGGLRIGFAVCSRPLVWRLSQLVPPLQASEWPLFIALRLLQLPDPFRRLRARVREVKPRVIDALGALPGAFEAGHPELGWIVVAARHELCDRLAAVGIRTKPMTRLDLTEPTWHRLSVPLDPDREARFFDLLRQAAGWEALPT